MKILISPDPMLREVCSPVGDEDDPAVVKKLAKQMGQLMYKYGGVGLAAPQVGVLKRFFVFDTEWGDNHPKNLQAVVNPKITWLSKEKTEVNEGCLSIPGCSFKVVRPRLVTLEGFDLNGEPVIYEKVGGLTGQCLQHECDHLDGKTIFENLDPVARIDALMTYREALAQGAAPGDVD